MIRCLYPVQVRICFQCFGLRGGPCLEPGALVHPLCLCDQMQVRHTDSNLLPCGSKLLPSKLATGRPYSIHHSCSTFSRACLPFFTEIPQLTLPLHGLSLLSCYFVCSLCSFYNVMQFASAFHSSTFTLIEAIYLITFFVSLKLL